MKKTILRFTPEVMARMFDGAKSLQQFLLNLTYDKARHQSKTLSSYAEDGAGDKSYLEQLDEKESLEGYIPNLRNLVESLPEDDPKRKGHADDLYRAERRLERVNDRLRSSTAYKTAQECLEYDQDHARIEAIDALVDHVGAWFETGAIGPGTVEFNGKTFTAN